MSDTFIVVHAASALLIVVFLIYNRIATRRDLKFERKLNLEQGQKMTRAAAEVAQAMQRLHQDPNLTANHLRNAQKHLR